jgi:hypothetical protein
MGDLTPVIGMVSFFAICGWILRSILDHRRSTRTMQAQVDLQRQLIEKMSSSEDLLAYLQSDAGQRLASSVALDRGNPLMRVLGAVQAGIILVVVGGALILMRGLEGLGSDAVHGFVFLGTLAVAVGAGFLLSSAATYALSKRWGLVGDAQASGSNA